MRRMCRVAGGGREGGHCRWTVVCKYTHTHHTRVCVLYVCLQYVPCHAVPNHDRTIYWSVQYSNLRLYSGGDEYTHTHYTISHACLQYAP